MSRSDATQSKAPPLREDNPSADFTHFVPESEVSQSNIMMELPQESNTATDLNMAGETTNHEIRNSLQPESDVREEHAGPVPPEPTKEPVKDSQQTVVKPGFNLESN